METPDYIASLRLVGGDLSLDFVNTVDGAPGIEAYEDGFECLKSYGDLVCWGHHAGLLTGAEAEGLLRAGRERPSEAEAAHGRALAFRSALFRLFRSVALGEETPPESLEALRRAEAEALARATLTRDGDGGGFDWEWQQGEDLCGVLWPVAHSATVLLTSGPLDRLKSCVGCWWLFIDSSRNRSRRWCTMEDCGTHEKMRRYIERRAAKRKDA